MTATGGPRCVTQIRKSMPSRSWRLSSSKLLYRSLAIGRRTDVRAEVRTDTHHSKACSLDKKRPSRGHLQCNRPCTPKADMCGALGHVCYGPIADMALECFFPLMLSPNL